jgi:hypothetical protein
MTLAQLKDTIMRQANQLKGCRDTFNPNDADDAYDEAKRECGFDFPESDDIDVEAKELWILKRMRRWFLMQGWMRHLLAFDAGDMEARGIVKNFQDIITKIDKDFADAKEELEVFADAGAVFGQVVYPPGFIDDRIGQTMDDEVTNRE